MTRTYFEKSLGLRCLAFVLIGLIWIFCMPLAVRADVETNTNEISTPAGIYPGLDHFLALVDPAEGTVFDPQMVGGVLDFIETPKKEDAIYYANRISGLTSAYYEFDISTSLEKLAGYSFNADIPAIATMPSSARLFRNSCCRPERK